VSLIKLKKDAFALKGSIQAITFVFPFPRHRLLRRKESLENYHQKTRSEKGLVTRGLAGGVQILNGFLRKKIGLGKGQCFVKGLKKKG